MDAFPIWLEQKGGMREEGGNRHGLFIVAELSSGSGFARRRRVRVHTFTAPACRPIPYLTCGKFHNCVAKPAILIKRHTFGIQLT